MTDRGARGHDLAVALESESSDARASVQIEGSRNDTACPEGGIEQTIRLVARQREGAIALAADDDLLVRLQRDGGGSGRDRKCRCDLPAVAEGRVRRPV